jgi:hypothetical protein
MRHLLAGLLYLYPRTWRDRYGRELLTLAEDTQMKWSDPIDVITGALTMRIDGFRSMPVSQIVLALTLVGAVVGGIVAKTINAQYISAAVIFMDTEQQIAGKQFHDVFLRAITRRTIAEVIEQQNLYPDVRKRVPLEDVVERFKRNLRVSIARTSPKSGGSAVEIAFVHEDGRTAQRVTMSIIERLVATNASLAATGSPLAIKGDRRSGSSFDAGIS